MHNVSTHKTKGKTFSNLHVMVDREINLSSAHKISEILKKKAQSRKSDTDKVFINNILNTPTDGM